MADAALILNRLSRARSMILSQVEHVLDRAIATGRSAKDVARQIGDFLNPNYSLRRSATGALSRVAKTAAHQTWPAGAGMASAPARTIAVTEIAQSHGTRVKQIAERSPGWFLKWTLAPNRRKQNDLCDQNAKSDQGWGPGIYRGDATPIYPDHPRCRCVLLPWKLGARIDDRG